MSGLRVYRLAGLIAMLGMIFGLAGCNGSAPQTPADPTACFESDKDYILKLVAKYQTFETYAELAGSTPRLALPAVITKMNEQQLEVVALKPSSGCTGAYTSLSSWMTKYINSLTAFMTQKPDLRVAQLIREADEWQVLAATNLNRALENIGQTSMLTVPEGGLSNVPAEDLQKAVEVANAPDVEVVDGSASFRVQERNNVWWKFAYRFELRNNADREQSVDVEIKFVDSDGYEVDDARAYDITIPANGTTVHSDSTLIDTSEARSVTGIRIEQR